MGIMLVYDITNEKSFENIVKWLRNINEVRFLLIMISISYNILYSYNSYLGNRNVYKHK